MAPDLVQLMKTFPNFAVPARESYEVIVALWELIKAAPTDSLCYLHKSKERNQQWKFKS